LNVIGQVSHYLSTENDLKKKEHIVLILAAELRRAINNGFVWCEANSLDVGENHFLASF
jgi:hypothetical protein